MKSRDLVLIALLCMLAAASSHTIAFPDRNAMNSIEEELELAAKSVR